MKAKTFDRLLWASLFFLAHWFFGNLYEEIVLVPNQIGQSYEALQAWQGYFTRTNQIYYYVPFTQLAVLVLCWLYWKATNPRDRRHLKHASLYGLAAIALTAIIVTQLNLKLFFGDLQAHQQDLDRLSVLWLVGNAVRLYLVGMAGWHTIQTVMLRYAAQYKIA